MLINVKSVPILFCEFIQGAGNFLMIWLLLELSMSTIMRFLFIFVWKQVYTINDNLVSWSISILNIILSACLTAGDVFVGNHRTTMWFICAGPQMEPVAYKDPTRLSGGLVAILCILFSYLIFGLPYIIHRSSRLCKR